MRFFSRFVSLSWKDRALLISAGALLSVAGICLKLMPWRAALQAARSIPVPPRMRFTVAEAEWAVGCASRWIPGSTCLSRALALNQMLSRGGHVSRIHLGVTRSPEGRFAAHAWVEHDRAPLLDDPAELEGYARLLTLED